MNAIADRALNETETRLVEQSKQAESLTGREIIELVRQLRERREAIKRSMRERARASRQQGRPTADRGAEAKKAELVAAIERVSKVLEARRPENWGDEPVRGPSKPTTKPEPKAQAKSKSKTKAKAKVESKAKADKMPKAEDKPKAAAQPKAATKPEAKPGADEKPKSEKVSEPKSEPKTKTKSKAENKK